MADKKQKLILLFDVDSSKAINGISKVRVALESQVKSTSDLATATNYLAEKQAVIDKLNAQRNSLINELNKKYENTITTIAKLNSESSKLNDAFKLSAAAASVTSLNKTFETTYNTVAKVNNEIAKLTTSTATSATTLVPPAQKLAAYTPQRTQTAPTFSFTSGATIPKEANGQLSKYIGLTQQADLAARAEARNYTQYAAGFVADNRKRADAEKALTNTVIAETNKRAAQVQADFRGYTPLASGTVAENRAKVSAKLAEESALIERKLSETRAREDARENERIIYKDNLRKAALAREVTEFQQAQQQKESALKYQIDRQIAIEKYGIDSIQVARVTAANKAKILQEQLAAATASINTRVAQGTISAAQGTSALTRIHAAYKTAILNSTTALNAQEKAHQQSIRTQKNLFVRIGEIIGIYKLYILTLQGVKAAMLSIPTAGIQQQATQAAAYAIFGTEQGAKNLKFLQETALDAGQGLRVLEESYRRYASSAILAGAKQEEVNKSFRDFAEVGTILHLPEDKLNSVFLALDQMYAKGVTQSEEIKKQLGNVLPGAVEIGAEAMKMTPAAFMDAMKKNQIIATEFVPKFAELYRKIFGGADDSVFKTVRERLFANLMRIKNSYENIARDIFAITQETLNNVVKLGTEALDTVRGNLQGILQLISTIAIIGSIKAAQVGLLALFGAFSKYKIITAEGITYTTGFTAVLSKLSGTFTGLIAAINPFTVAIGAAVAAISSLFFVGTDVEAKYTRLIGASKSRVNELMALYATQGQGAEQAGEELVKLARLQDNSKRLLIEYKGEQISFGSIATAVWNNIAQSASYLFDIIQKGWEIAKKGLQLFLDKLNSLRTAIISIFTALYTTVKSFAGDIIGVVAGIGAAVSSVITDIEQRNYSGIIDRAYSALQNKTSEVQKTTADAISATEKQIGKATKAVVSIGVQAATTVKNTAEGMRESILLNAMQIEKEKNKLRQNAEPTISTPKRTVSDLTDIAAKQSKGASKAASDFYKNLERDIRNTSAAIEDQQKQYDRLYQFQAISIEEYFDTKSKLLAKDLKQQIDAYTIARQYAEKAHDASKVEEYSDKIEAAYSKIKAAQTELSDRKAQENIKFLDIIIQTNTEYAKLTGNLQEIEIANTEAVNKKYRDRERLLEAEIKIGRTWNQVELDKLRILKQHDAVMNNIKDNQLILKQLSELLAFEEERVKSSRKSGLIDELQATNALIEARKRYTKEAENSVLAIQQAAAANKQDREAQLAALTAQKEYESVKYAGAGAAESILQSGEFSFIRQYEEQKRTLKAGLEAETAKAQDEARKQMLLQGYIGDLELFETYQKQKADIENRYSLASVNVQAQYYGAIAQIGANAALGLTEAMQKMYGANSKEAQKAFILYKAFAIAQATMNIAEGITKAIAEGGYLGLITGAVVATAGAVQIAKIISQPMPAAHGGLTSVPKEQTYLLDRGERVLSPNQNKDLTNFINNTTINNQSNGANIRIINSIDPSVMSDYLGSTEGEQVIMNVVRRNKEYA